MFLTLEDPRARIKGSRDPLGVQPLWSAFGRHVVTNLTTVTTSIRGFTVLMLGRMFAQRLREEGKIEDDEVLDVFLRCEQLGAYARHVVHPGQRVLGIEQVQRNASGGGKVWIEASSRGRILSDQKTYGLWGLYTVSARASGLLDEDNRPTPATLEHLDRFAMPHLQRVWGKVEALVKKGGLLSLRQNDPVLRALGNCFDRNLQEGERTFYAAHLRDAEHATEPGAAGRQARLRSLLERHGDLSADIDRAELERVAAAAAREDEALARRLERILALEAFLAPAEAMFGFLQARHGHTPQELATSLREHWGARLSHLDRARFDDLRAEVGAITDEEFTATLSREASALTDGAYEEAIHALLDWNRIVMSLRNAAPWIRLDEQGRLDVRFRGAEAPLPCGDELPGLWSNPYFIDSLKAITRQLQPEEQAA